SSDAGEIRRFCGISDWCPWPDSNQHVRLRQGFDGPAPTCPPKLQRRRMFPPPDFESGARAIADQEAVIGVFGHLPPQILVVAEGERRFPALLEIRIGGGDLVVELERRLEA